MDFLFQNFLFEPGPIVWVQRFVGLGHPLPFRLVDLLASTWGVLFAIALGLWLWGREDAYALAAIVAVEALVNLALNQLLSVPRPDAPQIVKYEQVGLGSFPSGHVFTATALWGLLWARGRVPLWLSATVVLGVGVGRLYLGVHYLADVVAGLSLGVLLVWGFVKVWPSIRDWFAERSYSFLVGAGIVAALAVGAGIVLMSDPNHFMWNATAIAAAGIVALLVEYRWVRFSPRPAGWARAATKILMGLLGILPLLAVDRLTGEGALRLGAGMAALAAVWALLAAPALFRWWGWGQRDHPRRAGAASAPTTSLRTTGEGGYAG